MTPPRQWWAWAGRLALTLVFVLGTLASVGGRLAEAELEGERTVECGEEGEPLSSCGLRARVVRRSAPHGPAAYGHALTALRAPPRLDAVAPEPPSPGWLRPRRVPPPDDEDALG